MVKLGESPTITHGPITRKLLRRDGYRGPILIVDDEPALRHAMAVALRLKGYAVAVAANGADALRAVEAQDPSLVILDMHMPVMDGWSFADALKKRGRTVPMLVMTTGRAEAADVAVEIGACGSLPKPFMVGELLETVVQLGCAVSAVA